MAGHAVNLAQITFAAVDAGDHAQGHVQFVEHRALLDVDFHKAQILAGVALYTGNVFGVQPHMGHGLAHGNAVGIGLV